MKDYCLPLHSFETVENLSIEDILSTPDDADFGFIVNVDLQYPDEIHEAYSDFPMAPTKESVPAVC